ncbi:MAG: MFS transporter [Phycisphaerales bacterium]|nr:MFS transporter [Phycisphaerales bacterium]
MTEVTKTGRKGFRDTAAGIVGNVLEWYDFAAFGFLAPYIAVAFFPSDNEFAGLIKTFAIFAVGYLMRPLGAILFGHIGDRVGRREALLLSVIMMIVPTILLGMLPTYAAVGITAPILLLLLRLIQGLSIGGEFTASATFVSELAPEGRKGLHASLTMLGAILGILLGSGVAMVLSDTLGEEAMSAWAWRLPFLMGIILGAVAFWMRRSMSSSPEMNDIHAGKDDREHPLIEVLKNHRPAVLRLCSVVLMQGASFYVVFVWLSTYLKEIVQQPVSNPLLLNTIGLACLLPVIPLAGWLSDRFGRRALLMTAGIGILLCSWPLFIVFQGGDDGMILVGLVIFALLIGMAQGPTPAMMTELFPPEVRLTGIGIGYNVTLALFGGTAPLISTWLISATGTTIAPAFYLMTAAAISLVGAFGLPGPQRQLTTDSME